LTVHSVSHDKKPHGTGADHADLAATSVVHVAAKHVTPANIKSEP
jgi:hypothetical protein